MQRKAEPRAIRDVSSCKLNPMILGSQKLLSQFLFRGLMYGDWNAKKHTKVLISKIQDDA
jgi:hypothetical protein